MPQNRAIRLLIGGSIVLVAIVQGVTAFGASPKAPTHPAVEANDLEWSNWHAANAEWLETLDFRARYTALKEQVTRSSAGSPTEAWRLDARFRGLSLAHIRQLETDGVVQAYAPFETSRQPTKPLEGVFVTSDMLLHAYNVMTADFVRGMEMQRAPRLRRNLEAVWSDLHNWSTKYRIPHERLRDPLRHARRMIGTALLCLESPIDFSDSALKADCEYQRELILSASATELPKWLEPKDRDFAAIDYRRMKPVGFYDENETLTRLFRAVRWLQSVPFRPERNTELIAFAMIADAAQRTGLSADVQIQRQWLGLPNAMSIFGPSGWTKSVVDALRLEDGLNLDLARSMLNENPVPVHANDDLRIDPALSGRRSAPPLLKVLPAYLTADALVFSEVMTIESSRLPEGRMITGYVGDAAALTELKQAGWADNVIEVLHSAADRRSAAWVNRLESSPAYHPFDDTGTFNSALLNVWAALFLPPCEGAPAFMRSPGWLAKSRNAVLAAWAEKKHTWVLHEVEPMGYAAGVPPPPPPGLVEPNPEFFRRLASLAELTLTWLETNGYSQSSGLPIEAQHKAASYLALARVIHDLKLDTEGNPNGKLDLDELIDRGLFEFDAAVPMPTRTQWKTWTALDFAALRAAAIDSAEAVLHGLDPASQPHEIRRPPIYRHERWSRLVNCAQRLVALSEKQLRGEEWTPDEAEYLTFGIWRDYVAITQVGDNGDRPDPKSLGPKIAPVASDPNSDWILHAGTGAMDAIYVLYPWKGRAALYRGLVTPYYEYPSKTRLNDDEWRQILQSDKKPEPPTWLAALRVKP